MDGSFPIGSRNVTRPETFRAADPATDALIVPDFSVSTPDDVTEACALAEAAFRSVPRDQPVSGAPRPLSRIRTVVNHA